MKQSILQEKNFNKTFLLLVNKQKFHTRIHTIRYFFRNHLWGENLRKLLDCDQDVEINKFLTHYLLYHIFSVNFLIL